MEELTSVWQGSVRTAQMVANAIEERWGEEAAKDYDPRKNCFTYQGWKQRGYQVKRGAKAIRSITYVEAERENEETGEIEEVAYPKTVYLFYKKQVKKVE